MQDIQGIIDSAQTTGYMQGRGSLRQLVLDTIGENRQSATPEQDKVFQLFVNLMLESFSSDELPADKAIRLKADFDVEA